MTPVRMEHPNGYVETTTIELQIYRGANCLFVCVLCHPQVVRTLLEMVADEKLVTATTVKAMNKEWSKLTLEAKDLLGEGLAYNVVMQQIQAKKPDEEIAGWIVSDVSGLKTEYAGNFAEGNSNVSEAGRLAF